MASISLRLKSPTIINLKPHYHHQHLLTFTHLYSSSSSNDNDGNAPVKPSDFFSDIKSRFTQQNQQSPPSFRPSNFTPLSPSPSAARDPSFDAIRKNLAEFRLRSSDFTPPSSGNLGPGKPISANRSPSSSIGGSENLSFDAIRASLGKMKMNRGDGGASLNSVKNSFTLKPPMLGNIASGDRGGDGGVMSRVIGGSTESLPGGVFGKEIKEKEGKKEKDPLSKFMLFRPYKVEELGDKLKQLRPEVPEKEKEGWFSLSELQQRIGKLREIEEKQSGKGFLDLRRGLASIKLSDRGNKSKKPALESFDLLSQPGFMASPPKEHLIEKYFHPDNMSAAEKLKIELKRVRDEFKMSESDCGSARVQIAQLTTEISHLSSVLQKKDKHSRRGLQAKVQKRKKLLKYLRRTDWESYCFVLDKLGLRDHPDNKS